MAPGVASSAEPQGWRSHPDGDHINKGLLAERGHWDNTGRVKIRVNALALNEIRDVLRFDPVFSLEERHVVEKPLRPVPWKFSSSLVIGLIWFLPTCLSLD